MQGLPAAYRTILAEHRARLARVSEGGSVRRLKRLYDNAQAELESKLRRLTRADRKETFSAVQARALLAQVKQGQAAIAAQLAGELGDLSERALIDSIRGVGRDIVRMDAAFTPARTTPAAVVLPVEEASRFAGVIDKRRTSLLRQHEISMNAWGDRTVAKIEEQMGLSMAIGDATDEAISRIAETADAEWYRAERIVRTETAWAFNAAAATTVDAAQEALPDLRLRWVELCDDESGEPLDDRVAVDSIAMHGQVALEGVFTMPATAPLPDATGTRQVPESLVGLTWPHPPDRPHDRAVVQAWRPGWGVPAWEWRGRRIRVDRAKPSTSEERVPEIRGAGVEFVSPNVSENTMTADEARGALASPEQKLFRNSFKAIDQAVDVKATVSDAVGAWADGAENTTVSFSTGASYEQLRAAAAMKGLAAEQKAVIVFKAGKGSARLHSFTVSGDYKASELSEMLVDQGLKFHTLVPSEAGWRVLVFEAQRDAELGHSIKLAAQAFGSEHEWTNGRGEFLGSFESRPEGMAAYENEKVVADYLKDRQDLAEQWKAIRAKLKPRT